MRFYAWWKGERALGGQDGAFFHQHVFAQRNTVAADGRQRGWDPKPPSSAPLRDSERDDAHRVLERIWEAIDGDSDDAREHHRDVLLDCIDRARRRRDGDIVDTLDYWKSKWASRRRQRRGGQDD